MNHEVVMDSKGQIVALFMLGRITDDGAKFYTHPTAPMQVGTIKHRAGRMIEPHWHRNIPRVVQRTTEVLLVVSGIIEVNLYDAEWKLLRSKAILSGEAVVMFSGGHGFRVIDDCEIIEVKQGPYLEEHDKVRFSPPSSSQRESDEDV